MRLVLVVNAFPHLSEGFISQKAAALRQAGLDVSVHAERPHSEAGRLPGRSAVPVQYTLAGLHPLRRIAVLLAHLVHNPPAALRCLVGALRLCGFTRRGLKTWLRALPFVSRSFDIVHFEFSGIAIAYAETLPLLRPSRLVMSCRGTSEKATPLLVDGRAEKLKAVITGMDKIHCVSEDMTRTMAAYGLSPERAFLNPPAVDAEAFRRRRPLDTERRPFVLLSVGRLHWIKALDQALLAVKRVVDVGWDVRYDILGTGDEESRLRFQAACLGLNGRVRFVGRGSREDVRSSLEDCDLLLLSSLSEGISNSVLEAMAMEVPVVSTAVGGMGEAIRDGIEGFLVPWGDPETMAARITALLASPERRRAMGAAGRRRIIEGFNLERQTLRFLSEYQTLLAGEGSPARRS